MTSPADTTQSLSLRRKTSAADISEILGVPPNEQRTRAVDMRFSRGVLVPFSSLKNGELLMSSDEKSEAVFIKADPTRAFSIGFATEHFFLVDETVFSVTAYDLT